jgi:hypothetical protein
VIVILVLAVVNLVLEVKFIFFKYLDYLVGIVKLLLQVLRAIMIFVSSPSASGPASLARQSHKMAVIGPVLFQPLLVARPIAKWALELCAFFHVPRVV